MDRPEERLALIEVLGRDGQAARHIDVHAWPVRIGRSLRNAVVLDDPHVALEHAVLDLDDEGAVCCTALDSHNGVQQGGSTLATGLAWRLPVAGALLQVGRSSLRVRLPAEDLATERPLEAASRLTGAGLAALLMAVLAMEYGEHALRLDPGADLSAWLPQLVGVPLVLLAWCAIWALLSKLFQHHFDFMGHLRIALPWMLLIGLTGAVWPQLGASLDSRTLWQLSTPLEALGATLLVHAHLRRVLPARPRAVDWTVACAALLAAAVALSLTWRNHDSWSATPYAGTLPIPATRLAGTVPAARLLQELKPLAGRLALRARQAREQDRDDGAGAEE
jgi:hypothetical protein